MYKRLQIFWTEIFSQQYFIVLLLKFHKTVTIKCKVSSNGSGWCVDGISSCGGNSSIGGGSSCGNGDGGNRGKLGSVVSKGLKSQDKWGRKLRYLVWK